MDWAKWRCTASWTPVWRLPPETRTGERHAPVGAAGEQQQAGDGERQGEPVVAAGSGLKAAQAASGAIRVATLMMKAPLPRAHHSG